MREEKSMAWGKGFEDGGNHVTFFLVEPKKDFHIIVVFSSAHQNLKVVGNCFGWNSTPTLGSLGRKGSLVKAPSTTG